jgi:hypothetical protein
MFRFSEDGTGYFLTGLDAEQSAEQSRAQSRAQSAEQSAERRAERRAFDTITYGLFADTVSELMHILTLCQNITLY